MSERWAPIRILGSVYGYVYEFNRLAPRPIRLRMGNEGLEVCLNDYEWAREDELFRDAVRRLSGPHDRDV